MPRSPATFGTIVETITVSIRDNDEYIFQQTLQILVGETTVLLSENFELLWGIYDEESYEF